MAEGDDEGVADGAAVGEAEVDGSGVGTSMAGPEATVSEGLATPAESLASLAAGAVGSAATELCAAPVNTSPQARSHAVNFLLIEITSFPRRQIFHVTC